MANKITVTVKHVWDARLNRYVSKDVYSGGSWIRALWCLWRQRKNGEELELWVWKL